MVVGHLAHLGDIRGMARVVGIELFDGHVSRITPANTGSRPNRFARGPVIRMGGFADTNIELGGDRQFRKSDTAFCEAVPIASNLRLIGTRHYLGHREARSCWR